MWILAKGEIRKIGVVKKQFWEERGKSPAAQRWQVWQQSFLLQGSGMPVEWFFPHSVLGHGKRRGIFFRQSPGFAWEGDIKTLQVQNYGLLLKLFSTGNVILFESKIAYSENKGYNTILP